MNLHREIELRLFVTISCCKSMIYVFCALYRVMHAVEMIRWTCTCARLKSVSWRQVASLGLWAGKLNRAMTSINSRVADGLQGRMRAVRICPIATVRIHSWASIHSRNTFISRYSVSLSIVLAQPPCHYACLPYQILNQLIDFMKFGSELMSLKVTSTLYPLMLIP
jgi:hypothetical protein